MKNVPVLLITFFEVEMVSFHFFNKSCLFLSQQFLFIYTMVVGLTIEIELVRHFKFLYCTVLFDYSRKRSIAIKYTYNTVTSCLSLLV